MSHFTAGMFTQSGQGAFINHPTLASGNSQAEIKKFSN
jgi:hypothetical protein